jgi:Uma2 family endonuclease
MRTVFPATRRRYFEGALEIMTVSARHENWERRIDFLVRALAVAMGMDCESFGSVTMRRKDLRAGIEADACFYFGPMAAAIRGCAELNLHTDPAPELAVEVDVSRQSNSKLPLYAALGIGEIWRFTPDELVIYRTDGRGEYLMVQEASYYVASRGSALTQLLADAQRSALARMDGSHPRRHAPVTQAPKSAAPLPPD